MSLAIGLLLLAAQMAGCSGAQENFKKRGIEFRQGKVFRVFRF
jgi:hypothetical protein